MRYEYEVGQLVRAVGDLAHHSLTGKIRREYVVLGRQRGSHGIAEYQIDWFPPRRKTPDRMWFPAYYFEPVMR